MKNVVVIIFLIYLCYGCHGGLDQHTYTANPADTMQKVRLNKAPDTSIHPGTITDVVRKMTEAANRVSAGNKDLWYANLMVIHSNAVIEICTVEFSQGQHNRIFEIAQRVLNAHKKQLINFQTFIASYKKTDTAGVVSQAEPIAIKNLEQFAHSSITEDNLFLEMLAIVEQSEIDIAGIYQQQGKNPMLREMASNSITANRRDIPWLRSQMPD